MNAMNQIIIEGNVVRNPTMKETPTGKKVSILPIAVNHFYKDAAGKDVDEVGFYDVEAWGEKFTERVVKYGLQGRGVRVIGRLKQDRWKDSEGKNRSKIFIVAEHVDFKPMKKKDIDLQLEGASSESYKEDEISEKTNLELSAQGIAQEETVF